MEEMKKFQSSTFDTIARRRLVESYRQDTGIANEINCMNDSRDFQDGQGDGVPKACLEQAAADSRGSRTCVCAITFSLGVVHAGREG